MIIICNYYILGACPNDDRTEVEEVPPPLSSSTGGIFSSTASMSMTSYFIDEKESWLNEELTTIKETYNEVITETDIDDTELEDWLDTVNINDDSSSPDTYSDYNTYTDTNNDATNAEIDDVDNENPSEERKPSSSVAVTFVSPKLTAFPATASSLSKLVTNRVLLDPVVAVSPSKLTVPSFMS